MYRTRLRLYERHSERSLTPVWDLAGPLVFWLGLRFVGTHRSTSVEDLSQKTVFQVVEASCRRVGDAHALSTGNEHFHAKED